MESGSFFFLWNENDCDKDENKYIKIYHIFNASSFDAEYFHISVYTETYVLDTHVWYLKWLNCINKICSRKTIWHIVWWNLTLQT